MHHLVGQVGADALELHPHGLTAEHVLDADLAQLARDPQMTRTVGQQLEHGGHRAHRDPALAARGHDACAQRPGRRRDRDHDLVGLDLVEDPRQVLGRGGAEHLEAVLVLDPLLAGIVVDEPDRTHPQLRVARELAHDQPAAVATAHDQHVASALLHAEAPVRPSTMRCTRKRAPSSSTSISRKNSAITLAGSVTGLERPARGRLHGVQQRDSRPRPRAVATITPLTTAS